MAANAPKLKKYKILKNIDFLVIKYKPAIISAKLQKCNGIESAIEKFSNRTLYIDSNNLIERPKIPKNVAYFIILILLFKSGIIGITRTIIVRKTHKIKLFMCILLK